MQFQSGEGLTLLSNVIQIQLFFEILLPHHILSRVHALTAAHLQFTTGCGSGRGRIWREDVLTKKQGSGKGKVQYVDSREPLGTVLHRL